MGSPSRDLYDIAAGAAESARQTLRAEASAILCERCGAIDHKAIRATATFGDAPAMPQTFCRTCAGYMRSCGMTVVEVGPCSAK